jgi:hypothetical protein
MATFEEQSLVRARKATMTKDGTLRFSITD